MLKLKSTISALALVLGISAAPAAEFKIGSDVPLTGSLARVGEAMSEGVVVATDIFNRTNGTHTIKLTTIDNESAPAKAVAAIDKLADQGVVAFSGGYASNLIGPASEAAERLGKVYMTSGGISGELVNRGLKTFFRVNNSDGYARAMAGVIGDLGMTSAVILYSTKEATESGAKRIEETLKAQGVAVEMVPFDPAINDFKPLLHKIKVQGARDALMIIGYENDYIGVLRAAKVLKPEIKAVLGPWSLATPKMWDEFPDLMNTVFGSSTLSYPAEFRSAEEKEFADTYQRLYKKAPDYLSVFSYVQSKLLFEAVVRAHDKGSLDKGGIADELRAVDTDTLIGRVKFGAKGDNVEFTHRMGQHQNGKIVLVWPATVATGKAVFPGVPWK